MIKKTMHIHINQKKQQITINHNKNTISNYLSISLLLIPIFLVMCSSSYTKPIEDLDSEYCISQVQSEFLPWWEDEWEETVTGFRIRASSFDIHTLHTLQHWKGRFPFNDYFLFSFNYFTDADADSQFYKREMELKFRIKKKHYLSLFGYPYYDKKESDMGIRYSFEETPFDFFRFSITFENAPNNYTFKNRNMDSMRIYKKRPILYSLDISIIKKAKNRLILSYSIEPPFCANYENKNREILNKTEGEKSSFSIKVTSILADSSEWGWKFDLLYMKNKFLSHSGVSDSTCKGVYLRPTIYLNKKINPLYNLFILYNYNLEKKSRSMNKIRRTLLLGIIRNFSTHSKIGLSYCHGTMDDILTDKLKKDNRLICSAEHRFKNNARVGINLGVELDTRDVTHGSLGRYDKLFLFIQYPIRRNGQ